jgi:hypothetical protein
MKKLLMGIAAAMALCVGTAFALEIESPSKNPVPTVAPSTTLASANLPAMTPADTSSMLRDAATVLGAKTKPSLVTAVITAKINLPLMAATARPNVNGTCVSAEPVEPDFTGYIGIRVG